MRPPNVDTETSNQALHILKNEVLKSDRVSDQFSEPFAGTSKDPHTGEETKLSSTADMSGHLLLMVQYVPSTGYTQIELLNMGVGDHGKFQFFDSFAEARAFIKASTERDETE